MIKKDINIANTNELLEADRKILGTDCIQQFQAHRDTNGCEITQKLACSAKAFVDLVGAVDIGVIYEAFPADSCTRFFAANYKNKRGTKIAALTSNYA